MGRIKDSMITEEMGGNFFEEKPVHKPLSVRDESLLPVITPCEVIFREMGVGLKELMGNRFPDASSSHLFLPKELTVMTYTVYNSFSMDILEIIKHSAKELSLKIIFCYKGGNISGVLEAFDKIFSIRKNLDISITVNPHTHIKMLQIDDALYMGSMNFSSTADSINDSKLDDDRESYYSHEVLFYYKNGGKKFSTSLTGKIEALRDSFTFKICHSDYKRELTKNLRKCKKGTIGNSKIINNNRQRSLDEKNMGLLEKMIPELIRSHLSTGLRWILDINEDFRLEPDLFSDDEVEKTVNFFKNNNGKMLIDTFLQMECTGFIKRPSIADEDEDEDEQYDEFDYNFVKSYLAGIADSNTKHLGKLTLDENIIRDGIRNERYALDNGEGDVPWGEKSEEMYEKKVNENKVEVIQSLNSLLDEMTGFILSDECYDSLFFIKK